MEKKNNTTKENRINELAEQFFNKLKNDKHQFTYKEILVITHKVRKAAAENAIIKK